jgi:hypothetical protein
MRKQSLWPVAILALVLASVSVSRGSSPSHADLTELLPALDSLEGWSVAEGPGEYHDDTLWEYLDGGAPRYLSYGFRCLIHVRYQLGDDMLAGVTLDVFDMGDELGAFGIYRAGLPRSAEPRKGCTEGYRSGLVAAAWRNNIFIHAMADADRPALVAMLEELLTSVCGRVTGDPPLLAILDPLPSEGRVARSERYVAKDLLGHAVLPGGILAEYKTGGGDARLFFCDLGTDPVAGEAVVGLRAHYKKNGVIDSDVPSVGVGGFRFTDPGLGDGAVVRVGRFVAGVHGDSSREAQEELLARLVENLAALASEE